MIKQKYHPLLLFHSFGYITTIGDTLTLCFIKEKNDRYTNPSH